MTWKRVALLAVALVVLGSLVWGFLPKPVDVEVGAVRRGPLRVTVDEEGETRVRDRYLVSAPISGLLTRIDLEAGDAIRAGDALALVAPAAPPLQDARAVAEAQARVAATEAALLRAEQTVRQAAAELEFATVQAERVARLAREGVVADEEADRATTTRDVRRAERRSADFGLEVAKEEVRQARVALQRVTGRSPTLQRAGAPTTTAEDGPRPISSQDAGPPPDPETAAGDDPLAVRSPVSGVVLRLVRESAGFVAAGTPLLEIGDPGALEIVVDVLSTDAVQMAPGQDVRLVRWGGGTELVGRLRRVEPSGFTKVSALGVEEQRVNVVVDLTDGQESWAALGDGYSVEARIVTWSTDEALLVPASALFRRGEGWAVFVVEGERLAVRPVEIGHRTALLAEVVDGLAEDVRVVLHPGDRLDDGVRVRAREDEADRS